MERRPTRLEIPHPNEPGCNIVGVLEQLVFQTEERETRKGDGGRKIALILHGVAGHKDYLFLKRLALRLPMDSFRFDFRGNHETPGPWSQGGMENDLEDLRAVVDHLFRTYQYQVDLVVGHSRGSLVGFRWMCTVLEGGGQAPSGYVNASARYRMRNIYQSPTISATQKSFKEHGFHTWSPTVARKVVHYKIYPEDVERFATWDSSLVWDRFPSKTDVLTIHGLKDKTVSPYDAVIYSRALGSRSPGTHNLHFIESADHNFTGLQDEVVDVILEWWDQKQAKTLKTGMWQTGVKVKL